MEETNYRFAFPINVSHEGKISGHDSWEGIDIGTFEKSYSAILDSTKYRFQIIDTNDIDDDESNGQKFVLISGCKSNDCESALEEAFSLSEYFLDYFILHLFENYFSEELLYLQFSLIKRNALTTFEKKDCRTTRSTTKIMHPDFKNFGESFSLIYHDNLLKSILSSFRSICGPHDIRAKYYIAFMALEQIEGVSGLKMDSLISIDDKRLISKKVDSLLSEIPTPTRKIISERLKNFISGRGTIRFSRSEQIYFSLEKVLEGNLKIHFGLSETDMLNVIKGIVETRNKLFHNSKPDSKIVTQNMKNLIIILRLIAKSLLKIKINPYLPFNENDA